MVLPSVHAILNFATKFFEMLTKKQSEHPQKVFQVFQVFRVFQVFHVRFWTRKPPGFGPNPNKPEKSVPTHLRHKMGAENTQKGNSPTFLRTRSYPASYRRSFFGRSRLFVLFLSFQHPSLQTSPPQAPAIKIAGKGNIRVCRAVFFKFLLPIFYELVIFVL